MTYRLSGARVTVLPFVLPKTPVGDLEMAGKLPLTWGGRYWVRTSDLFGVKNVRAIFCAGRTAKRLVASVCKRPLTTARDASSPVHAPACSQPEVPDGWPFISYDPTTYEPIKASPRSLLRRSAAQAKTITLVAVARTLALAALLVIARHALAVYGGN